MGKPYTSLISVMGCIYIEGPLASKLGWVGAATRPPPTVTPLPVLGYRQGGMGIWGEQGYWGMSGYKGGGGWLL